MHLRLRSVVKEVHRTRKGKAFNVSYNSLAGEILGYVYPDRVLSIVQYISGAQQIIAKKLLVKTAITDHGESGVDSNVGFGIHLLLLLLLFFNSE